MSKILITGGAGFIGSNIARKLISLEHQVTILDNFNPQIHGIKNRLDEDLQEKVELIVGTVTHKETFYRALEGKDSVIHLAAETGTGQSMYDISNYTNINIQGTSVLCDFIINVPHHLRSVIVASSRSIYGEGKYLASDNAIVYPLSRTKANLKEGFDVTNPITGKQDLKLLSTDEESKIHPASFYGITKQVQEQMIILATQMKQINGFALRYQNVYGPGQSLKNPYTGILSIFSRLALKGEPINIFEDGDESRDFVFINDVVDATIKCLEIDLKGQFILNVGSGISTPVIEVAREIVSFFNSKSEIFISGAFREGDIRHNYADLTRVKKILEFEPKISFKDGLHQFLSWVLVQKDIPASINDYKKSLEELSNRGLFNTK